MMSRITTILMVIVLACSAGRITPNQEASVKVSDDGASLARHISVPATLNDVRWAAQTRGESGLGPTDLELVAWFPVVESDWPGVEQALGPPGEPAKLVLPAPLTLALGIGDPVQEGLGLNGAAFENSQWRCVGALRQNGGVLVFLVSR